ncbi:MAG: succinate dehydrogenase assembly factor 2 [Pseudomonadota bacterium]
MSDTIGIPGTAESAGTETTETRRKRLKIRCWRRATKEMDLILGPFADNPEGLARLSGDELNAFEALVANEDTDLYKWFSGGAAVPAEHAPMLERILALRAL